MNNQHATNRVLTQHSNAYADATRAGSYSELKFPNTYFLAYRDIPEIIGKHVKGHKALDFGCGTGRSTRYLRHLGMDAEGADISEAMLMQAKKVDIEGKYILVKDGDLSELQKGNYHLIFCSFTFDNIADQNHRINLFKQLKELLTSDGCIVFIDSTPDIYINEWASFTTKAFTENLKAKSGEKVKIVMLDVDDKRPVEDILWTHEDYKQQLSQAGLTITEYYLPLARCDKYQWVSEKTIAPWIIYVAKP